MLAEQDKEIINKHKIWGFGAYLQWACLEYPFLQKEIAAGKCLPPERLENANKRMASERTEFDHCYLSSLPKERVNPLKTEQEAWVLLSPIIEQYLSDFDISSIVVLAQALKQRQLLGWVAKGMDLLGKWNIISDSYRAKYYLVIFGPANGQDNEAAKAKIKGCENTVKELIRELQQQSQV